MAGFLYWKPVVSLKLNLINILSSQPVAGLIRAMLKNKIPHCGRIIYTNNPIITNKVVGHIFFKTYESSEVRFVREFLRTDLPTIELGCSLGVVAMQIAAKTKQPVYSVEANPLLIPVIENNFKMNGLKNSFVFNSIIAETGKPFFFIPGDNNTTGNISDQASKDAIKVKSTSLSDFLKERSVSEYILVCDIEGAEMFILNKEMSALDKCRQLIIELHDTKFEGKFYSVEDMVGILTKAGFTIVSRYGPNAIFER